MLETSEIIRELDIKIQILSFLGYFMPWKVIDKRRNENTISKGRETKNKINNHKYRFSVLISKKKTHFRDSCQLYHGIN